MVNHNQSSNVATDAFGDTIFLCIGRCGGWTTSTEEVCEVCEENGLSRELILMEDEFDEMLLAQLEADEMYKDSVDEFEDFDDDYGFDYDFNMESEGRDWD